MSDNTIHNFVMGVQYSTSVIRCVHLEEKFMKKNEDRRVRKTKKAMTEALAALLEKKPLNEISVREISEIADINRGTFYLHYRDIYDMVERLQNEIFEEFNQIVDQHEPKANSEELFPMLVELMNLLSENASLAKVLIGKNGDAAFVDKLKNVVREKCFIDVRKQFGIKNDAEFNYFYHYIVSGCIGIFSEWLNSGMKGSPQEMADFIGRMIISSVRAVE